MTAIIKIDDGHEELVAGVENYKEQRAEQLRDSMPGKASQIDADTVDNKDVREFTSSLIVSALEQYDIDVSEDDVTVVSG